ncbi:hypothetical protein [Streptomyces pini]|nr:hypothetical protein [Streptomyces pini]
MPDGLNVLWLERDGEGLWAVREGCSLMDAMSELNMALVYLSTVGLWLQRWGGPCEPPQLRIAA